MQDIPHDILSKAAQGDLQAFEIIYKTASGFVYNVALRVVNNKEDAEEVTQEVFLTVYHKLRDFRFESSLKTWIYRITVNAALNYAKKTAVRRNQTVEYDDTSAVSANPSDVQVQIEKEHHEKVVEELLGAVNAEQRACVVLRNIEGFSYEEIARTLEVNINTVRSRLKRAREKMLAVRKQVDYGKL